MGSVLGLGAVGLSLIFGVLRVVNLAHGAFLMLGMYITYWLFTLYGLNPVVSLIPSLIVGLLLGAIVYQLIISRIMYAPELSTLVAGVGLMIFLEEAAKVVWEPTYRGFIYDIGTVYVGGIGLPLSKVASALLSLLLVAVFFIVLYKTKLGTAVRALMQDPEGAALCGINVRLMYALMFSLGVSLALMSGSLIALHQQQGIHPYVGHTYLLIAFVIVVLGGLGSLHGAYVGGILVGVIISLSTLVFTFFGVPQPIILAHFIAFLLILIILLLRPQGLFGGK